jgi:hypothetical protein
MFEPVQYIFEQMDCWNNYSFEFVSYAHDYAHAGGILRAVFYYH